LKNQEKQQDLLRTFQRE